MSKISAEEIAAAERTYWRVNGFLEEHEANAHGATFSEDSIFLTTALTLLRDENSGEDCADHRQHVCAALAALLIIERGKRRKKSKP